MSRRTTMDVAEFLAMAGAYLRHERARNTVLLTTVPAEAGVELAAAVAGRPLIPSTSGSVTARLRTGWFSHFPHPRLLTGDLAFPGRGCILELIMLISGHIVRYVA